MNFEKGLLQGEEIISPSRAACGIGTDDIIFMRLSLIDIENRFQAQGPLHWFEGRLAFK